MSDEPTLVADNRVEPEPSSEESPSPQYSRDSSELSQGVPNGNYAPPTPKSTEPSPTREAIIKGVPRSAATSRHIQDLETKIKTLEKQAEEYREKLATFEKLRTEKERYQSIIDKLQAKLQPQSQELSDLRKQLKESQNRLEEAESKDADNETSLEAALLDREAAEVEKELVQSELSELKNKIEDLQLDLEVLREENDTLNQDVTPEERQSQSWLHRERENERLREALMRLRDISQDTEAELKSQLSELESDMKQLDGIQNEYEETKKKLRASEAAVNDLKEQLDEALDAENTTEKLTSENMALQDQMDQLKVNIQELEDLKELSDELEFNHIEAEKQMQEELDFKDSLISDQRCQTSEQDDKLKDYEYTIAKFRELVQNLQSHLEDMRASQQITEAEAEELNNRSKAMTDLNMKLQSSAEKAEMNTIDLESRRLEAQEAIEHLAIVQIFLPDSFKSERDSVLTYLRFRRIAAKARLFHTLLRNKLSSESGSTNEDVFTLCGVLDKTFWVAAKCDRFVNYIRGCSLENFARFENALHELDPVERGFNVYIENVKNREVKEKLAAEEIQRSISLLTHLAEVYINSDDLASYADDVVMKTSLMQSYLENTATAMSLTRSMVVIESATGNDTESGDSLKQFATAAQSLIGQTRSAKVVASKSHHSLADLKARCMSLDPATSVYFVEAAASTESLAHFSRQLGSHLRAAISAEESNSARNAMRGALMSFCSTHAPDTTSTDPLAVFTQRLKHTTTHLSQILELSQNVSSTSEFASLPSPWQQRAESMRTAKQTSQNTEQELLRLKDTLQSQSQQLRARDQSLEESNVKIELLEARTRDAAEKAGRINELQSKLESGRKRERQLAGQLDEHAREVKNLGIERDHWKGVASNRRRSGVPGETQPDEADDDTGGKEFQGERANVSNQELEALREEVHGLQGAVQYLRQENRRTKLARPEELHMAWLQEPLFKRRRKNPQQASAEALKSQAKDVFSALRSLVDEPIGVIDLSLTAASEKERLKWRPAKEKTAWKVARHAERWASWKAKSMTFLDRAEELKQRSAGRLQDGMGATEEQADAQPFGQTGETLDGNQPTAKSPSKQAAFDSGVAGLENDEQFHEAVSNADREGSVGVAR